MRSLPKQSSFSGGILNIILMLLRNVTLVEITSLAKFAHSQWPMCNFFVMSNHYSPRSLAARKPLTTAGTLEEISGAGNSYNMKTLLENALAARRPLAVAGKKTPLVSQHRTLLTTLTKTVRWFRCIERCPPRSQKPFARFRSIERCSIIAQLF